MNSGYRERGGGWLGKVGKVGFPRTEISENRGKAARCVVVRAEEDVLEPYVFVDDGIPVGERAVGGADAVVAVGKGGSEVLEDVLHGFGADFLLGSVEMTVSEPQKMFIGEVSNKERR